MADPLAFTVTRVLSAPRALAYLAHAEPRHLQGWISPEYQVIHSVMNLRVGGSYHFGVVGPNGVPIWGKYVFQQIIPDNKLSYIESFSDKEGGLTRHPTNASWPLKILATIDFEDTPEEKTKIQITWLPYDSDDAGDTAFGAARQRMRSEIHDALGKLENYLRSIQLVKPSDWH